MISESPDFFSLVDPSLEAPLPQTAEGLEALHTHLHLIYRYGNDDTEVLIIKLELFQRLLELKYGVQISGID